MGKLLQNDNFKSILASVIAILLGLLVGLIILYITSPNDAYYGFITVLKGGLNSVPRGVGSVLYTATPVILTGLSVGFAFKTGLFNIGASGQFIVGGFAAVYIGLKWLFIPRPILWIVALLGAILAGALWAGIVGLLKAYRNVNEVITSIMLNYIGVFLVNYLVLATVYDSRRNQSITPLAQIPKWGFDKLLPNSGANGGILIAVAVAIIIYIIIDKTTFGYELKAVGFNRDAAHYAGINEKRSIVFSMMIAGAIAGLAGGLVYLSGTGVHIEVKDIIPIEGFNGIPVALLANSHPLAIIFSGLFVAHLNIGGFYMQRFDFVPEVIDMMVAVIIYFSAFALAFKNAFNRWALRLKGDEE
ncbi:MAG: ABC transporter permease [Erysipelothrix sp.]|jgi:simple sugar transport system permease protein|nr:ABC transporter permease [Erysipelothrix sp.]